MHLYIHIYIYIYIYIIYVCIWNLKRQKTQGFKRMILFQEFYK